MSKFKGIEMTRTYAAKRLFEHGPLTCKEFHEITGWTKQKAYTTLQKMTIVGTIVFFYPSKKGVRHYKLAD